VVLSIQTEAGGQERRILTLAWFEGVVVSIGAAGGIISAPRSASIVQHFPLVAMPTALEAFASILAFGLVAWLGWCVHVYRPNGLTGLVWGVMLACMLAWRPLCFAAGAILPGAGVLALAVIAAALLVLLVAAFSRPAGWVCVSILIWLGCEAVAVIEMATRT
jgi:hypothetical protein